MKGACDLSNKRGVVNLVGVASNTSKMATEGKQVLRRNRPGTKAQDLYSWPPQDFNDMDTILAG